tara:strand:+ start:252 stop:551 length:300 start_codon:yes stop_codon:yes gene_type:complete
MKFRLTKKQREKNRINYQQFKDYEDNHSVEKFNSLDKVKIYLKSKGYRYDSAFNFKEDRYMLWKNRKNTWLKVYSAKDFLNKTTMEQGTVWNIEQIQGE